METLKVCGVGRGGNNSAYVYFNRAPTPGELLRLRQQISAIAPDVGCTCTGIVRVLHGVRTHEKQCQYAISPSPLPPGECTCGSVWPTVTHRHGCPAITRSIPPGE